MTSSLTDRYVHAVTSRLPAGQREDIARELRGTIEDTVTASPEPDPTEAERQALRELGHPAALANEYRGAGQFLIGPAYYPAWLHTVKTLLVFVPAVVAGIMLLVGLLDSDPPGNVVGEAIASAFWATSMVLFWVTLGFAIAERTGDQTLLDALDDGRGEWDPEELPEPAPRQVSWGDSIFSVILNAFLVVVLLLPLRLGGAIDGFEWGQIFTDAAYDLRWVLAIGAVLSLLASVSVMARGRWTWPTAIVNLVGGVLFVGPIVWLAARNDLYAWETLPVEWVRDGSELVVNEQATLITTVVVVLGILLWETIDSFRKAARRH